MRLLLQGGVRIQRHWWATARGWQEGGAAVRDHRLVRRCCIVKPGLAAHFEMHIASDNGDRSNDFIRLFRIPLDGHVVGQLGHTFFGEKSRQQNGGVGQIELAYARIRQLGFNLEAATRLIVEQRCKNRRRIEVLVAEEIDRARSCPPGRSTACCQ